MLAFTRFSLARQFLVISLLILVTGMLGIGAWVSRLIQQGVLNRTASITALYVDSFVSPYLQVLQEDDRLTPENLAELDRLITETSLGQQIVSFKIWSEDGQILYNADPDQIGLRFAISEDLDKALKGEVTSSISDLDDPENEHERQHWDRLIETYAPVRAIGSGEILAVSEFYQRTDELAAETQRAQLRSWLVVGVATFAMYGLLAGLVGRASNTILAQQAALEEQLEAVRVLLSKNRMLHQKVRRAAGRITALNERFLRRISADLHDGPGQDLALALMRIEPMVELCADCVKNAPDSEAQLDNLQVINSAVASALKDLRTISVGLRLPELAHLTVEEVVQRATRDFQRKTNVAVALRVKDVPAEAPNSVKITLYRILQESLMNGYAHAEGTSQSVNVRQRNGSLVAEVSDNGKGFDAHWAGQDGHLGLAGMRERVEVLGGTFAIETTPGRGTRVLATIPLEPSTDEADVEEQFES